MLISCLSPNLTKWQRYDIQINLTIGTAQVLLIIYHIQPMHLQNFILLYIPAF